MHPPPSVLHAASFANAQGPEAPACMKTDRHVWHHTLFAAVQTPAAKSYPLAAMQWGVHNLCCPATVISDLVNV